MGAPVISRVEVIPILIEDAPLLNMQGVHQPLTPRAVIVLETSAGERGVGESYGDLGVLRLFEAAAAELAGLSIFDVAGMTRAVRGAIERAPREGAPASERSSKATTELVATIVSAFEVAMLDAQGRTIGVPVHELLGGRQREQVDFAGYLFYRFAHHADPTLAADDWGAALDAAGIVRQAQRMREEYGFTSFKLKGGVLPPQDEVAALRLLHREQPDAALRIDPNGAWSPTTSLRMARELRGLVEYLEDPCLDLAALAQIERQTGVPIATNMMVATTDDMLPAAMAGAVQVLLIDHHYWGGLRAAQTAAHTARALGWEIGFHSNSHLGVSLAAMVHLAASVGGHVHACDTHMPWQSQDIVTSPWAFDGGAIAVPRAPGLGVELDDDAVAALHAVWLGSEVRMRDDIAAMRAHEPDFTPRAMPRW